MENVLLIVDMQHGFLRYLDDAETLLSDIENLAHSNYFRATYASQFINLPNSQFHKQLEWDELSTPEDCEIHPRMAALAEQVIIKNSYSAVGPTMLSLLHGVCDDLSQINLYLVGVDTDACVMKTAFDLFDLGVTTYLVEDCCRSTGGTAMHKAGVACIKRSVGVRSIVHSNDLDLELKIGNLEFPN